jgi:hypothetical protein
MAKKAAVKVGGASGRPPTTAMLAWRAGYRLDQVEAGAWRAVRYDVDENGRLGDIKTYGPEPVMPLPEEADLPYKTAGRAWATAVAWYQESKGQEVTA